MPERPVPYAAMRIMLQVRKVHQSLRKMQPALASDETALFLCHFFTVKRAR
jgi:hypothetical protein